MRRASQSMRRAFSGLSIKPFQNAAELEAWLKRKGVSDFNAKAAAPSLFASDYTDPQRLLTASADALNKGGLSLALTEVLVTSLRKPPAKYSFLGETHATPATTVEELLQSIPEQKYPLVVLHSGQPMPAESPLESDTTYHIAYEFSFPEEFKEQPKREDPDHVIVAMEPVIAKAMKHVHENINKATGSQFRVPPVMIASLARSGKTLTLEQLFNAIVREGKYIPIFLTFNGQSGFKRNTKASDVEDFLRAMCTQLHPGAIPPGEDIYTYFSRQRLEDYLNNVGKPVVLLVDELNALAPTPSAELAALLREMFLDPTGRFLCFTSHRGIDLSEVGAVEGKLPDELGEKASGRGRIPVEVARTFDLTVLRTLVPSLPPFLAYLYCGLPGLVYSTREPFEIQERFSKRVSREFVAEQFDSILEQVCTGDNCTSPSFAEFTFRDKRGKFVWPLCYVQACFAHLPLKSSKNKLRSLIDGIPHLGDKGGLEFALWEYTVRAALALVLTYGTPAQRKLMGPLPDAYRVVILDIPSYCKTLDQAKVWIDEQVAAIKLATNCQSIVVLANPTYEKFSPFDGIIRCSSPEFSSWLGIQMKLGNDYPDVDCPADFPGVLIRGDPPAAVGFSRRQNWTYLTYADIEAFLPYSMRQFIPRVWKPEYQID